MLKLSEKVLVPVFSVKSQRRQVKTSFFNSPNYVFTYVPELSCFETLNKTGKFVKTFAELVDASSSKDSGSNGGLTNIRSLFLNSKTSSCDIGF